MEIKDDAKFRFLEILMAQTSECFMCCNDW